MSLNIHRIREIKKPHPSRRKAWCAWERAQIKAMTAKLRREHA